MVVAGVGLDRCELEMIVAGVDLEMVVAGLELEIVVAGVGLKMVMAGLWVAFSRFRLWMEQRIGAISTTAEIMSVLQEELSDANPELNVFSGLETQRCVFFPKQLQAGCKYPFIIVLA